MRKFSIVALLISAVYSSSFAQQQVADVEIFETYYEMNLLLMDNMKKKFTLELIEDGGLLELDKIELDGMKVTLESNIENRKKYKKIVFEIGGRKLITSGKIIISRTQVYNQEKKAHEYVMDYFNIWPEKDIRFLESGKVFAEKENITNEVVTYEGGLPFEDGSVEYFRENVPPYIHSSQLDSTGRFSNEQAVTRSGEYLFKMQTIGSSRPGITDPKIGYYQPGFFYPNSSLSSDRVIAPDAYETAVITLKNEDKYVGYSTTGIYHSKVYGTFTGYMLPLLKEIGNGSVLFREFNGQYEWALVVDGAVEMTLPATEADKPQLNELMSNLDNRVSVVRSPNYPMDAPAKRQIGLIYPTIFGEFQTREFESHSGYGVKYHTTDSLFKGDHGYLEVGFFKNGKLDGLGYRVKMVHTYNPEFPHASIDYEYKAYAKKVYAEAGIFENGNLKEGRVIDIPNDIMYKFYNQWSEPGIEGFHWIGRGEVPIDTLTEYETIPFSYPLIRNTEVYVEALNRHLRVIDFDTDLKALVVMNDDDQKTFLNEQSGRVFQRYKSSQTITYKCPTTVERANYKEVNVNHEIPRYTASYRQVKGVYMTTYYTTTVYDPIRYSTKKTVVDSYEQVACPKCNGEGSYNVGYTTDQYRLVDFKQ